MRFQIISAEIEATEYADLEAVIAAGLKQTGTSKNYAEIVAANPGAAVPREMLWDQPEFDGYAGPMYGKSYETGEECLRYEAWKAYEALSN